MAVQDATGLMVDVRSGERSGKDGGHAERLAKAASYAKQLEHAAVLFAEPNVRFPLAAVHCAKAYRGRPSADFISLRHSRPHDAWWACARRAVDG